MLIWCKWLSVDKGVGDGGGWERSSELNVKRERREIDRLEEERGRVRDRKWVSGGVLGFWDGCVMYV